MKSQRILVVAGAGFLLLGIVLGYFLKAREVAFEKYDDQLAELGTSILMMDALQHKKLAILKSVLISKIEGRTARMVTLYDRYRFQEGDYGRCIVTRKVRALYEDKVILSLSSRPQLDELEYPYDRVVQYLGTNCPGSPSHQDWTAIKQIGDRPRFP